MNRSLSLHLPRFQSAENRTFPLRILHAEPPLPRVKPSLLFGTGQSVTGPLCGDQWYIAKNLESRTPFQPPGWLARLARFQPTRHSPGNDNNADSGLGGSLRNFLELA